MLVQIVTENGQKKVIPLTADAGAGLPVGFIASAYKKGNYSGWLYLDGRDTTGTSEELYTHYPLLYAFLGSNILPDYREFALVGAEENTTDVYNASTNPNGTIHDHDVYTEGQAKDDQLQTITGSFSPWAYKSALAPEGAFKQTGTSEFGYGAPQTNDGSKITFNSGNVTRSGSTTHGKRKAVYFYIKATSGLSENAQDNVVAQLNEQRSYSTEEHLTGRKWIDGKPTYEKTYVFENITIDETARVIGAISGFTEADVVKKEVLVKRQGLVASEDNVSIYTVSSSIYAWQKITSTTTGFTVYYTLEYTKTT